MDVRFVKRALANKLGAIESRRSHHVYFFFDYDGKRYLGPKLSHSWRGDLDRQQEAWIRRPLLLNSSEFEDLIACPLSSSEFLSLWAERRGFSH